MPDPEDTKADDGGFYWLVRQGRTYRAIKSVERPDLTVQPGERLKAVFHKTTDLQEHRMMAERLESALLARREGPAL